jgi:general secretion pathway protein G
MCVVLTDPNTHLPKRRTHGFTLVEVMVVLAILAILASMAMPLAEVASKRSKERELKAALWEIRGALDKYKEAYDAGRIARSEGASGYPSSLEALVEGARDAKSGELIRFLRRIPEDPFTPGKTASTEKWGVRSYLSSAERPQPGADVYDVYSLSPATGLNGVPYRQW